jgi:hypothetical protein
MNSNVEIPDRPAYVRDVSVEDCDHDYVEVDRDEWEHPSTGRPRETIMFVCTNECQRKKWEVADERQAGLDSFERGEA